MSAELSLVHHALKDAVEKAIEPEERRELAQLMIEEHGRSVRHLVSAVPRSTQSYQPVLKDDTVVIEQLQQLVEKHPVIGRQCFTASGD